MLTWEWPEEGGTMAPQGGEPYEEGRIACEQGLPRSACPYELETAEYHAWIEGWDEAEEVKVIEGDKDAGTARPA